jgi:aryl-alcohol dehydrogenase-like predicted oxidoreductase
MEFRELGRSGLKVSALGLGCMGMSEFYGNRDDAESIRVIHRALDLGVDFLDTADMYGVGVNEELVEKACKPAQLALAWVLAQGSDIVPIPGTKRIAYLEDNVASAAIQLSAEDLKRLDEAAPRGAAHGDRYHAYGMKAINR